MSSPAYRAASHLSGTASGVTSATVTLPSGWQAGDLGIIVITQSVDGATKPSASGWTSFSLDERTVSGKHFQAYYRVLQAGDTNPVFSWTTSSTVGWQSYAVTGADTTTPENAINGNAGTASTTLTCPGVTPTAAETLLVWITCAGGAITKPASMTQIGQQNSAPQSASAYEAYTGTSATGNRNGSDSTSATYATMLIAIAAPAAVTAQAVVIG